MDNHKDLFLNMDKFDESNITYVKPVLFYKVSKNMGIYYKKELNRDIKSESDISSLKKNKKTWIKKLKY
jgi:hypothetical protein